MTTTRYIILIVLVTSAVILAGCSLSASTPPPTAGPIDSDMSTLEAALGNIATQTAVSGGSSAVDTQEPSTEATPSTSTDAAPETAPETAPENTQAPAQPTATPAPVFTATPGIPKTYELQKGEFPFCIARRFNVNQTELLNLNGLGTNTILPIEYTLQIPQTGNAFVGQRALIRHPDNYTVVAGDSIYSIACKFGDVDPLAIAQANELESPYNISSGQVLHIP
jgi:LysM repeat protein